MKEDSDFDGILRCCGSNLTQVDSAIVKIVPKGPRDIYSGIDWSEVKSKLLQHGALQVIIDPELEDRERIIVADRSSLSLEDEVRNYAGSQKVSEECLDVGLIILKEIV